MGSIDARELAAALNANKPIEDRFSNVIIEGDLLIPSIPYSHPLRLKNTTFRGRFDANEARFGRSVELEGCTFERGITLNGARIDGHLNLTGVTIRRQANQSGTDEKVEDYAANLEEIRIDGALMARKLTSEAGLFLKSSHITKFVSLRSAKIQGDLYLQDAVIGLSLFCQPLDEQHRTEISARAFLNSVQVGGYVNFRGVLIGTELNLKTAVINGALMCGPTKNFPTKNFRMHVMGKKPGECVTLTGLRVRDEVELIETFIAGDLLLNNAVVGTELLLMARPLEYKSPNRIGIGGVVNLRAARASYAKIDGLCFAHGQLDLSLAHITSLEIHGAIPTGADTQGLHFEQLTVPDDNYLAFLKRAKTFQKSAYHFMENWLRNNGEHEKAGDVYVAMRRAERARMGVLRQVFEAFFLDFAVRYGLQSWRVLVYLIPVFFLTWFVFASPQSVSRVMVVTAAEAGNRQLTEPSHHPERWEASDAAWMALRVNVPLITISPRGEWAPSSENIACLPPWFPMTYETFAGIVTLLNWVAVPLFLASVSGLIKREK